MVGFPLTRWHWLAFPFASKSRNGQLIFVHVRDVVPMQNLYWDPGKCQRNHAWLFGSQIPLDVENCKSGKIDMDIYKETIWCNNYDVYIIIYLWISTFLNKISSLHKKKHGFKSVMVSNPWAPLHDCGSLRSRGPKLNSSWPQQHQHSHCTDPFAVHSFQWNKQNNLTRKRTRMRTDKIMSISYFPFFSSNMNS